MSGVKYLKQIDERRGKSKDKILMILRNENGKIHYINATGKWEEAPRLKMIFEGFHGVAAGKYVSATEKEVKDFIASKKNNGVAAFEKFDDGASEIGKEPENSESAVEDEEI